MTTIHSWDELIETIKNIMESGEIYFPCPFPEDALDKLLEYIDKSKISDDKTLTCSYIMPTITLETCKYCSAQTHCEVYQIMNDGNPDELESHIEPSGEDTTLFQSSNDKILTYMKQRLEEAAREYVYEHRPDNIVTRIEADIVPSEQDV